MRPDFIRCIVVRWWFRDVEPVIAHSLLRPYVQLFHRLVAIRMRNSNFLQDRTGLEGGLDTNLNVIRLRNMILTSGIDFLSYNHNNELKGLVMDFHRIPDVD